MGVGMAVAVELEAGRRKSGAHGGRVVTDLGDGWLKGKERRRGAQGRREDEAMDGEGRRVRVIRLAMAEE